MRVELAEEVGGGHRARAALIVKADLVGHRVIAEDDRKLVGPFGHSPGTIQQLGMANMAPAVAADLAVEGAAEDFLVGGDPLDSVPRQQRDHRLADGAFARPHSARAFAENRVVLLDGAADMNLGVFRITVAIGGQVHVGHRFAREPLVEKQGQDRVIERGRRQLDLAAVGELAVERDDLRHELALLVEQPVLVCLGVPAALGLKLGELGVFLEEQGVHPGQVGPDLQVAEIAFAEPVEGLRGRCRGRARAGAGARGSGGGGGSWRRHWP